MDAAPPSRNSVVEAPSSSLSSSSPPTTLLLPARSRLIQLLEPPSFSVLRLQVDTCSRKSESYPRLPSENLAADIHLVPSLVAFRVFPIRGASAVHDAISPTNPEGLKNATYDFVFINPQLVALDTLRQMQQLQPNAKVGDCSRPIFASQAPFLFFIHN